MNHQQLITRLAQRTGLTPPVVKDVLGALSEQAVENFRQGEDLGLLGVGKLVVGKRAARTASNPKTGAPVEVPARRAVTFRMSQVLRETLS